MRSTKKFLVEIRLRDYVRMPPWSTRIVDYVEVMAIDESDARDVGLYTFKKMYHYKSSIRLKLAALCVDLSDVYAADSVEI